MIPQACRTRSLPLGTQQSTNKTQSNVFEPFEQKISASTQPMQIIANLPQMKEGEFDHEYMAQHLEQLQMDATLCSRCSPATKYFCSPEPEIQELYKKSCHWRQSPGTILSMDIEPYNKLSTPYYFPQNIGILHPENRPRGQVHIKRVFQFPQGNKEFTHIAKMSTL